MATKAWFDYGTYMANKLTQMQETYPNETWTAASLQKAFDDAGFVGDEGAQRHFQKYGHKEDVSPNKYFDADYYYQSKAIQFYGLEENGGLTKAEVEANMATYAKNMEGAIKAAGMDAWTHYIKYGTAEGVNPSNSFDTSDYMAAKLAALQAAEPSANWDEASMNAAFKKAGLNALEHFMQYAGKGDNEVTSTDIADFAVPESEQIDGGNTGETFTLTTAADTLTGTAKDDAFVAGEVNQAKTLTAGDSLDGGDGTDTLTVSSSLGDASYAGFTAKNIEVLEATSDGNSQTFDLSGTTDLTTLRSINSSADVTFNHVATLANVEATKLTEDANAAKPNITVQYENAAVSGSEDAVSFTLNSSNVGVVKLGSVSDANGGIESLALTANGGDSTVDQIDSDITTLTFTGDKNVTITNTLSNTVKTVDASAAKGGLSAAVGVNDVTFTGGDGDDTADFSAGWDSKDSFDGGNGNDTLGLTFDVARAVTTSNNGKVTNVEYLKITDEAATTASIDMDNFSGFNKVIFSDGISAGVTATVANAVTGFVVDADVNGPVANGSLVVDLKTDGSSDELTVNLTDVVDGSSIALINVEDAETATLTAKKSGKTGDVTVTSLKIDDATKLNISGDAAVNATGATAETPLLTELNAAEATGNLTLAGFNTSASGATITLGSGSDRFTVGTSNGADTFTLGDGSDTVVYTSAAQSSTKMDTIKDFVSGTDKIDLTGLVYNGNEVGSGTFVGNKASFGQAQGALKGNAAAAQAGNGIVSSVFQADENILWVDVDGDGTLSNNDFRIKLEGVTSIKAEDIGGGAGNTITLKAASAQVSKSASVNADNVTTVNDDTINTTAAFLNGSTIDGDRGTDTLVFTSAAGTKATALALSDDAAGGTLTNIETIQLANATNNIGFTANKVASISTVNGGTGADTITLANPGTDDTGTNDHTVTVSTGAGNDTVVVVGATDLIGASNGSVIDLGAGEDTLSVNGTLEDNTYKGGEGSDTVLLAANSDIKAAKLSGFETLDLADHEATMTVAQFTKFTSVENGDTAGKVILEGGGTFTAIDSVKEYDVTGAGEFIATISEGVSDVKVFDANAATGTVNLSVSASDLTNLTTVKGGAGTADSLTITGFDGTATDETGVVSQFETVTVKGSGGTTGDFTIAGAGVKTVDFSGLTTAGVSLAGGDTLNAVTTLNLSDFNDTVTGAITLAGATTIDLGAGSDTLAVDATGQALTLQVGMTSDAIDVNNVTTTVATGESISIKIDGVNSFGGVVNDLVATSAVNSNLVRW